MKKPYLSIVMSVFNGESYLRQSISSILSQTYSDYEFIIVNDGSTDNTGQILLDVQNTDPRIRIIEHENLGLTKSLNIAIERANGMYIARQDADDISLPNRLECQLKHLVTANTIKVVGCSNYMIDGSGKVINRFLRPESCASINSLMRYGNQICHGSVIMEKKAIVDAGLYDEAYMYAQDYELWLRMISKGFQINNVRRMLYLWRIHDNSIAGGKLNLQHESVNRILYRYFGIYTPNEFTYHVKKSFISDLYNDVIGTIGLVRMSLFQRDIDLQITPFAKIKKL